MKAIQGYIESIKFSLSYSFRFIPGTTYLMAVLYAVSGVVPYLSAFLLGGLVNAIIEGVNTGTYDRIWILVVLYAFVGTLPALFGNLQMYMSRYRMLAVQKEIDMDILERREKIDIARYENPEFLDLLERTMRSGINPIQQLSNSQFDLTRAFISFVVGTIISVHFSPWVYVAVIASAIPAFVTDIKFAGRSWSIWAKDSPELRRLSNLRWHIMNRTYLIETKLLQSSNKILSWIRKIYEDFAAKQRNLEKNRVWQTTLADLLAFSGFVVGLALVVRSVVTGESSVGTLVYIITSLTTVRSAIANTLEIVSGQYENSLIVQDYIKLFNTAPLIKEAASPVALNLSSAPVVVFENVSFKYPNEDKWVLRDINLTLNPGDKIGLVGNNGAGKTTFVKLLCRVYDPTKGRITINGVDLKNISLREWWSYLGVMFQDYATYDFKAKEAIAIGLPEAPLNLKKVEEAADVSQAITFIDGWKNKYDHQLGVEFGGTEPSKGQRQKLSIAKVVYRGAHIMILDEPTASVDAESEAKIFDSLENLSKNITALLISHDFSTILQCDHIFVLEEGELIENGSHDDLMKLKGKYSELFSLQAERFRK